MKICKNKLGWLLLAIAIFPQLVGAQHTNVLVGLNNSPNEPSICINPKNTQELVAGANLNNLYYSHDGGSSWTQTFRFLPLGHLGRSRHRCRYHRGIFLPPSFQPDRWHLD